MNSQIELLRKVLEDMANSGKAAFRIYGSGDTESTPIEGEQTKIAAQNILDKFPAEDSDHVKAYRSIVFLSQYLSENDFEDSYFVDQYTIEEQLNRVRNTVSNKARSDILERLEIDQNEVGRSGMETTHIRDPVSKAHSKVSNGKQQTGLMIKQHSEHLVHEILEAPLSKNDL